MITYTSEKHIPASHDLCSRLTSATSSPAWTSDWTHPDTDTNYQLSLCSPGRTLADADLDACFSLVEETSRRDYEGSSRGWDAPSKRREMRDADLRYVLVKDPSSQVQAFASLMPTLEEGQPVVYCYEIHLRPALRGTGLAGRLMRMLEAVAAATGVAEKVMLTVFTCNARAGGFYRRCGFERDGISPQPRRLRGGTVKMPDYEILSKRVGRLEVGAEKRDDDGTRAKGVGSTGSEGKEATAEGDRPAKVTKLDHSEPAEDGWETDEE